MRFRIKFIVFISLCINCFFAQESLPDSLLRDQPIKDPSTAIYMSLALPGAGQFYNESYTKSAIYFSSFAIFTYQSFFYDKLHTDVKYYAESTTPISKVDSEFLMIDTDGNTVKNINKIQTKRDDSIRKRNRAIWRGLGVYLLNVLDAYSGAYLFRFDDLMGNKKAKLNIENNSFDGIQLKFSYDF